MVKPAILAVEDEAAALQTLAGELETEFDDSYDILTAESGAAALEAVKQAQLRSQPVALVLIGPQMLREPAGQPLHKALGLVPDARRVLIVGDDEADDALSAAAGARLDCTLRRPWHPPTEHLYPVLLDLLLAWHATSRPLAAPIRVIDHRWSPQAHEIRDFLARNQVPYQWLDIESHPEVPDLILQSRADAGRLPIVLFPDGSILQVPAIQEVAERIGLHTHASKPFYDLIVVGGGPAGLAAAVYGASEGLHTVLIDREALGGQAGQSSRIENYLGFPVGLSGSALATRAVAQASRLGAELIEAEEVKNLRVQDPYRFVSLADGSELSCHALIIATGVDYRTLDAPGVARLTGAGVYYGAAITEALACRGDDVYIVGGANSAGQAAVYFSRYARQVTILARNTLGSTMSQYLVQQITATPNIAVRTRTQVVEAHGEDHLQSLTIANSDTSATETVLAAALFVFIGAEPRTDWLAGLLQRDPQGYILSGSAVARTAGSATAWPLTRDPFLLESSVPGVFVAGDVRSGSVKRVASSVGEGAMAVSFIHQYLAQYLPPGAAASRR